MVNWKTAIIESSLSFSNESVAHHQNITYVHVIAFNCLEYYVLMGTINIIPSHCR